jgi:hypothetical protein
MPTPTRIALKAVLKAAIEGCLVEGLDPDTITGTIARHFPEVGDPALRAVLAEVRSDSEARLADTQRELAGAHTAATGHVAAPDLPQARIREALLDAARAAHPFWIEGSTGEWRWIGPAKAPGDNVEATLVEWYQRRFPREAQAIEAAASR